MSAMADEFPDQDQRAAVCFDAFRKSITFSIDQVRKWCPACASYMQAAGMTETTLEDLKTFGKQDAHRICDDIWRDGSEGQRESFSGGTDGRERNEAPPRRWLADCLIRAGT